MRHYTPRLLFLHLSAKGRRHSHESDMLLPAMDEAGIMAQPWMFPSLSSEAVDPPWIIRGNEYMVNPRYSCLIVHRIFTDSPSHLQPQTSSPSLPLEENEFLLGCFCETKDDFLPSVYILLGSHRGEAPDTY